MKMRIERKDYSECAGQNYALLVFVEDEGKSKLLSVNMVSKIIVIVQNPDATDGIGCSLVFANDSVELNRFTVRQVWNCIYEGHECTVEVPS